ncbi:serine-rich adhesin for platelets-like [Athalia rosae]|uniref:serine-rich adhesin for platelets-like n=1 Tax=Athalia rosae TaxID=37344 RepID=UPI00203493B3|nr:serine-rich adhesin for platelets-like [Athalia rosae]
MKLASLALISLLSVVAFAGPIRDKTLNSALAFSSAGTSGGGLSIAHAGTSTSADGDVAEARALAVATIYSGNPFLNNQPLRSSGLSLGREAPQVAFTSGSEISGLSTKSVDRVNSKLSNVYEGGQYIGCFGDGSTRHAFNSQLEESERDNSFNTELNKQHKSSSENFENLASSDSRLGASEIQEFGSIASAGVNQNKGSNEIQGVGALNGKITYFAQSGPVIHIVTADNENKNEASGKNDGYGSTSAAGTVLGLGEVRDQHAQESLNLASHDARQDPPSVGLPLAQVVERVADSSAGRSEDNAKVYDSSTSSELVAQSNINLDGTFQNSFQNEQSSSSSSHSMSKESSFQSSSSHSNSYNIDSYASNVKIQDTQEHANSAILSQNQLSSGLSSAQFTVSVADSSVGQLDQSSTAYDSSKSSGIIAQSNINLDGSHQSSHEDKLSSSSLSQSATGKILTEPSTSGKAPHKIESFTSDLRIHDVQGHANSAILSESQNQLSNDVSSAQLMVSVAESSTGNSEHNANAYDKSESSGIVAQSNINLDSSLQSSHLDKLSSSSLSQSATEESSSQSLTSKSTNQLSSGLSSAQFEVSVAESSTGNSEHNANVCDKSESSGIVTQSNINLDGSLQSSHEDKLSSSSLSQSATEESSSQSLTSKSTNQLSSGLSSAQFEVSVAESSTGNSEHNANVCDKSESSGIVTQSNINLDGSLQSSHEDKLSSSSLSQSATEESSSQSLTSKSTNQLSSGLSSAQFEVSVAESSTGNSEHNANAYDKSESSGIVAQSNINLDSSLQSSHQDKLSSSSLSQSATGKILTEPSTSGKAPHKIESFSSDLRIHDVQGLANSAMLSESQNQLSNDVSSAQLVASVAESSTGNSEHNANVCDKSESSGIVTQSNINLDGSRQRSHQDKLSSSSSSHSTSEESSSQSLSSKSANQLSSGLSSGQFTVSVADSSAGQLDQSSSAYDSSKSSGTIALGNIGLHGLFQTSSHGKKSSSSSSYSTSGSSSQSSSFHSGPYNIALLASGDISHQDATRPGVLTSYGGSQVQQSIPSASGFLKGVVHSATNTSKRLLSG